MRSEVYKNYSRAALSGQHDQRLCEGTSSWLHRGPFPRPISSHQPASTLTFLQYTIYAFGSTWESAPTIYWYRVYAHTYRFASPRLWGFPHGPQMQGKIEILSGIEINQIQTKFSDWSKWPSSTNQKPWSWLWSTADMVYVARGGRIVTKLVLSILGQLSMTLNAPNQPKHLRK